MVLDAHAARTAEGGEPGLPYHEIPFPPPLGWEAGRHRPSGGFHRTVGVAPLTMDANHRGVPEPLMAESEKTYHSGWIEGAQYWIIDKKRELPIKGPFNFSDDAIDWGVAQMRASCILRKYLILRSTPKRPKLHVCRTLKGRRASWRGNDRGQRHYATPEEDE
jgi:hypothetical protein